MCQISSPSCLVSLFTRGVFETMFAVAMGIRPAHCAGLQWDVVAALIMEGPAIKGTSSSSSTTATNVSSTIQQIDSAALFWASSWEQYQMVPYLPFIVFQFILRELCCWIKIYSCMERNKWNCWVPFFPVPLHRKCSMQAAHSGEADHVSTIVWRLCQIVHNNSKKSIRACPEFKW